MYTKYLLVSLSALFTLGASALEVETAPGELGTHVTAPGCVTELTVTGSLDASDFQYIEMNMPELRHLDLTHATITAYSGDPINGISEYPANTIPPMILAGQQITSVALPTSGSVSIGRYAFAASSLSSVTIPANVVSIGEGAFAACANLTEATLTTAAPGAYSFSNCPKLATVALGTAGEIGTSAFADCGSLSAVSGTEGLKLIGDGAFAHCASLEDFTFGRALTSIGSEAFASTALLCADLSESPVKSIGDWAFAYNSDISSATLPAALTTLGKGVFFDCPNLVEVNIPEKLSELSDYALKGAESLNSANIPEGMSSIGDYSLKDASSVSTITLPSTVEYIGDGAMAGMTSLTKLDATALDDIPTLGEGVWEGVDTRGVLLPVNDALADAFKSAPQWQEFDIRSISTGADAPILDSEKSRVRGAFSGTVLMVESTTSSISSVEIYDLAGHLLAAVKPQNHRAAIETSSMQAPVYVVNCVLTDGTRATLKIAR